MKQNEPRPSVINEKTLVPVSLLVLIITGVVRVESTNFKANATEKEVEYLKSSNKEMANVIIEVKTSLARIEGALNTEKKQLEKTKQEEIYRSARKIYFERRYKCSYKILEWEICQEIAK